MSDLRVPEVFRAWPLSEYGSFTAIAELFHGPRDLRKVMDGLQMRLYARGLIVDFMIPLNTVGLGVVTCSSGVDC